MRVTRALISVSDKTGVVDFARALLPLGVEILSTGGTAQLLKLNGVVVTEVSDFTGFPEMMEGRVKTLHPKVHGGILARRDKPGHVASMKEHGIVPIDLVVVNLYPFAQTVAKAGVTMDDAIENIDIGGPAMVRAAAKNHAFVAVVTDPRDYAPIAEQMKKSKGQISDDEMTKVFNLGIGMVVVVNQDDAYKAMDVLRTNGHRSGRRLARASRAMRTIAVAEAYCSMHP